MIATIHQPDFMPWVGYFDKIKNSDILIFLDDVQFSRRGWTHRDKIKISNYSKWITIPVKKKNNYYQEIKDVQIEEGYNLKKHHLNLIKEAYRKSKNFDQIFPGLENIYNKKFKFLIDINVEIIHLFCAMFEIERKIFFSSNSSLKSKSSNRLVDILNIYKSKKYLTGEPSKNYIDLDIFNKNQIEIIWHKLDEKEYKKKYDKFDKSLSALDFLMNKK